MSIDYEDSDLKGIYLAVPLGQVIGFKVVKDAEKEMRVSQAGKKYPAWVLTVLPTGTELPVKVSLLSKQYRELLKSLSNPKSLVGQFLEASHELVNGQHVYTIKKRGGNTP
jgi:hypothetical protein